MKRRPQDGTLRCAHCGFAQSLAEVRAGAQLEVGIYNVGRKVLREATTEHVGPGPDDWKKVPAVVVAVERELCMPESGRDCARTWMDKYRAWRRDQQPEGE